LGDFLAALDDVLEEARTDDVAEGGLCAFDEGVANVGDTEGGFVRRDDVVIDDLRQSKFEFLKYVYL